jgi:hypothetical protein
MKNDNQFDRLVKKVIQNELPEKPSPHFTEGVMNKLGVQKVFSVTSSRPILSKKGKAGIIFAYLILILVVLIFGKETSSFSEYLKFIPDFSLSTIIKSLGLGKQTYVLLLILIGCGWMLILFDNVIRKLLVR